jgi:hypothetical protein
VCLFLNVTVGLILVVLQGRVDIFVDSTLHCFINHGCNGSNNVGHNLTVTEVSADPYTISPEVLYQYFGRENVYNPFAERQTHFYSSATPLRLIKQGEGEKSCVGVTRAINS